jgi:hypothetical protein
MGLDIFAVSHLRYVRPMPRGKALERLEAEAEEQGKSLHEIYFFLSSNDSTHRARLGGMKVGLYARTKSSRSYGFRAGSYSGYNWWRNELSLFALDEEAEEVWVEPRRYRGKPFVELIDFTDCDGRIGTTVAAKLAADFTGYAKKAARHATTIVVEENPDAGTYWLETYRDFATALRLAAKDGALTFC